MDAGNSLYGGSSPSPLNQRRNMTHQNFIYDIEVYPNVFTCSIIHHETDARYMFEHSDRYSNITEFFSFCDYLRAMSDVRMVGFNNEAYDYPVIHYILSTGMHIAPSQIYDKSYGIISTPFRERFNNIIWPSQRYIPQLDLYKIHHFDNHAKATSLKMLEFQMNRNTIEDLPYKPGSVLNSPQIDVLRQYNNKDTDDTRAFFIKSEAAITLRDELSAKYGQDMTNFNDTKIGKQYFINRLESQAPGSCYMKGATGRRLPRQTPRASIALRDVIFPYVRFEREEFNRVLSWFNSQVITETKGAIDDLHTTVDGFRYDFGTGGIHGSIPGRCLASDDTHVIVDIDVTSYYPSLAISNRVYPEHLGPTFCDIYEAVKAERLTHPKGTPENAMLKLALNGVYGDSNNKYGPFYDPQYTMTITINGQLLLCMLAEQVIKIPELEMIQINTDGLTVRLPRVWYNHLMTVCAWWEQVTRLDLEYAEYSRMWIRDVNNYIAETASTGKLKLKGAYMHDGRGWHQNKSALVVQKAVEAYLIRGVNVETFIRNHENPFDFCLRTKLTRASRLVWGEDDRPLQNTTRYYISTNGAPLTKIMPPTPAQVTKNPNAPDRRMSIQKGWKCTPCNNMVEFDRFVIDYTYYVEKAWELIEPVKQ